MQTESYSIGDLERLSGVKAHTIRMWEKRYGMFSPDRAGTGIRRYNNAQLRQLLNVSLLNQHGFKISRIGAMSDSEIELAVKGLRTNEGTHKTIEQALLISLLDMDEFKFRHAFAQLQSELGYEQAFVQGIFPFFERIGLMWQAGTISPAQEHFFSHLVKAELIVATRSLPLTGKTGAGTVLLFLPEQELHEIGLLFYNFALRRRGYHTIYLGQALPLTTLAPVIKTHHPDFLVTGATMEMTEKDFIAFCRELSNHATQKPVYFTGPVPVKRKHALPKGILLTNDLLKQLGIAIP